MTKNESLYTISYLLGSVWFFLKPFMLERTFLNWLTVSVFCQNVWFFIQYNHDQDLKDQFWSSFIWQLFWSVWKFIYLQTNSNKDVVKSIWPKVYDFSYTRLDDEIKKWYLVCLRWLYEKSYTFCLLWGHCLVRKHVTC